MPRGCLAFFVTSIDLVLSPTLIIAMADQNLTSAAKKSKKKGRGIAKLFRDLTKQPQSATDNLNDLASQSNSTRVSVFSAFGAHDSVPGNDAGSAEPSKFIVFILVLLMMT